MGERVRLNDNYERSTALQYQDQENDPQLLASVNGAGSSIKMTAELNMDYILERYMV